MYIYITICIYNYVAIRVLRFKHFVTSKTQAISAGMVIHLQPMAKLLATSAVTREGSWNCEEAVTILMTGSTFLEGSFSMRHVILE